MKLISALPSLSLLLLAMACNDYGLSVQPPPDAPLVEITPAEPQTANRLRATVVDPEPNLTYLYEWYRDGRHVDDMSSDTVPSDLTAKGELWQVQVIPMAGNLQGSVGRAEVEIFNTPPSLEASWANPAPSPYEDLVVLTTTFDPDDDQVSLSFEWSVDGIPLDHDAPDLSADETVRGQVWQVTVRSYDGEESGESVTLSAEIGNTPPVVGDVTLGPDPAFTDTLLVAQAHDVYDADGDEVELAFDWFVEGSLVQTGAESTLSGDHFIKGDRVFVDVTPFDGEAMGPTVRSHDLFISNSPPTVSSATVSPSPVYTLTLPSCSPGAFVDADGDPEGYRYAWTVDGDATADTATLSSDTFVRGQRLQCTLTPYDGEDEGPPVPSDEVVVANTPPVLASVAIATPSPLAGTELTLTLGPASDDDEDPVTFSYEWFNHGVSTGHTGPTYSGIAHGDVLHVVVTPHDPFEPGSPVSSAPVTVGNTPPEIHSLVLGPNPATTVDAITATTHATDADGHELSYTYQWFVDTVEQPTTAAVLSHTAFVKHQTVYAQVRVSDGHATVGPYTSAPLTISNSPPSTPPTPSLTPVEPYDDDSLVCTIPSASTDPDSDPITYDVQFYRNGAHYSTYTGISGLSYSLPASHTSVEELWSCRFRARDDDGATSGWSGFSAAQMIISDLFGANVLYFTDDFYGTDTVREGLVQLASDGVIDLTVAGSRAAVRDAIDFDPPDILVYFNQMNELPFVDSIYLEYWALYGEGFVFADWRTDPWVFDAMESRYASRINQTSATFTDPRIAVGVSNPITFSNPSIYAVFTMDLQPVRGGVSACNFGAGNSCLVFGNGGRTANVGFLNDTISVSNGRNLTRNIMQVVMESL
ncbi:MAG: hypothetical protein EA397_07905 [Deltaproteobacteria bacterium]|nr:MAG: hypothetical protein EA397_07905 [Deltaproteobacteria bacterium]